MSGEQVNPVSGKILIALSLTALLAVLSGYTQPRQPDEGTAAHIFQLSIVAILPVILLSFATADWKQPLRKGAIIGTSRDLFDDCICALYYLEHYR